MTRMTTSSVASIWLVLVVLTCSLSTQSTTLAFPISSSRSSSKKNRSRPQTGGGTGFGKGTIKVDWQHTIDTSVTPLLEFLQQQGSLGVVDSSSRSIETNGGIEVGISTVHGGRRGIFCTRSFQKGEILCQIPSDCALAMMPPPPPPSDSTADSEQQTEQQMTLVEAGLMFWEMYMTDVKAKEVWKSYLETLPTLKSQFDPTPDFYSDEELELIEFPRVIRLAKQRQEELSQCIAKSVSSTVSYEELQFATWLVSSRCFQLELQATETESTTTTTAAVPSVDDMGRPILKKNTKSVRVMVPLLDMVNHSSDAPNVELHLIDPEKDDAWFALKAIRPIPAGKEVFHSYGSGFESSVELFVNHGFVPSSNRIDAIMLDKSREKEDVLLKPTDWTTTLEEDEIMLEEATGRLRTILQFRIRMKQAFMEMNQK